MDPGPTVPFTSLNEASISLRQIDVHYIHLMFSGRDSNLPLRTEKWLLISWKIG